MNQTDRGTRMKERVNQRLRMSHYKELSNKILDGLDNLTSKGSAAEVRWIWELIQNAKDASIGQDQVEISIIANDKEVIFSHSGNPFTMDDIFSIINQTSSKNRMDLDGNADDENIPETTGKFGTGFITTHLLSRVIYLQSVFKDFDEEKQQYVYRQFKITLDRSARNLEEFIVEYDKLFKIFDDLNDDQKCPFCDYKLGGLYTSFTYPLADVHNVKTMKQGIANFRNTAAYVIAFNPKIKSIKLNNEIYTRQSEQIISSDFYQIRIINGSENDIKEIIVLKDKIVQMAFTILRNNTVNEVQPKDLQFPGLFSDFPLIGSQTFLFPCIVNSHVFWPNEERSSIILKQSARARINQQVLEKAIQLILRFMSFTQNQIDNWKGLEHLCHIKIPDHADFQWYRQTLIVPFANYVSKMKCIRNQENKLSNLAQIYFPKINFIMSEDQAYSLWKLIKPFYPNLIQWDHSTILKWFEIFSHDEYWTQSIELKKSQIDFFTAAQFIVKVDNVSNLKYQYFQNKEIWANVYLMECYNYITQYHKPDEWQGLVIFANQNGTFKKYSQLRRDEDEVDSQYKEILLLYNINIRNELFSQQISLTAFKQVVMKSWNFKDCVTAIQKIQDPSTKIDQRIRVAVAQKILLLTKQKQFTIPQQEFLNQVKHFYPDYLIKVETVKEFDTDIFIQAKKQLIQDVCDIITRQYSSLTSLKSKLNLSHKQSTELLEGIYADLTTLTYYTEWKDYKIFVNQNGSFQKYDDLQRDHSLLDEDYKEILKSQGNDIRANLFALDISLESFKHQKMNNYTFGECVDFINTQFTKFDKYPYDKQYKLNQQYSYELAINLVVLKERNSDSNIDTNAKHVDFVNWAQHYKSLGKISSVQNYDYYLINKSERIVLTNILKLITEYFQQFSDLEKHLKMQRKLAKEWLIDLYSYMVEQFSYGFQSEYKVFVDQNYKLQYFKNLRVDVNQIDSIYKDILLNHYYLDQRDRLFSLEIDLHPMKNYLTNSFYFSELVTILEEQIKKQPDLKVAQKLICLLPEQFQEIEQTKDQNLQQEAKQQEQKDIQQINQWIDVFYCTTTNLVTIQNYSKALYNESQSIIVREIVKVIRQKQTIEFIAVQTELDRIEWLKMLYNTIKRVNKLPGANITLDCLVPNQNHGFIEQIKLAKIDEIVNNPDLVSQDFGLQLKEMSMPILDLMDNASSILVNIQLNEYFKTDYQYPIYSLKDLAMTVDNYINKNRTTDDFYEKYSVFVLKLNEFSSVGLKQDKFAEHFPLFDQNRDKLIATVHTQNKELSKNICQIMNNKNGQKMLETVCNMNNDQMNQFDKVMSNENGQKLLKEIANLSDQEISLGEKCIQLLQTQVLTEQNLQLLQDKPEQFQELMNMPDQIRQKLITFSQDQDLLKDIENENPDAFLASALSKYQGKSEKLNFFRNIYSMSDEEFHKFNKQEYLQQEEIVQQEDFQREPALVIDVELEKQKKQEARYMQNPNQFFSENLITNQQNLAEVMNSMKCSEQFRTYVYENSYDGFAYVQRIIERAVKQVKEKLSQLQNYDITNWRVEEQAFNKNIIKGVKKFSFDIVIVIRPTDGGYIKFHQQIEKMSLIHPYSELWGNNNLGRTQQLTFGKMINWNNINEFTVEND